MNETVFWVFVFPMIAVILMIGVVDNDDLSAVAGVASMVGIVIAVVRIGK